MFKYIVLIVLASLFCYPCKAHSSEKIIVNHEGKSYIVSLEACYDPVTKKWEPCYVYLTKDSCTVNK